MATEPRKLFWIDLNRFDLKPDKSTWVEMGSALHKHGYETVIVAGFSKKDYQPQEGKGVRIHYVSAIEIGGLFRITLLFNIIIWCLRNVRAADIIVLPVGALLGAPLLRLFGKKNIVLDIRTVPAEVHGTKGKIDRWLFWSIAMRRFCKNVRAYSFITERLRDDVEEEFGIQFPDHVIWESGVNTTYFQEAERKKQSRENPGRIRLFYHGTVSANRGLGHVLEAFAALEPELRRNMEFVIVGPGPDLPRLKQMAKDLNVGDKVIFKGYVPYESIAEEIAAADICICPLTDRPEWRVSSPLKVMEYMAAAKPLIATPIPAHKDVLQDSRFVVWTEGYSPTDYAEAIKDACGRIGEISEAAGAAPDIVRAKYDWSILASRFGDYMDRKMVAH